MDNNIEKKLKINSLILIFLSFIIMIINIGYVIYNLIEPSTLNIRDNIGKLIMIINSIKMCIFLLPLIISGFETTLYIKKRTTSKLCIIFDIVGILIYSSVIFFYIILDQSSYFLFNYSDFFNLKIFYTLIILIVFILPLIINIILVKKTIKNNF